MTVLKNFPSPGISNHTVNGKKAAIQQARQRMQGVFTCNQVLGRTLAIGCTAVEITQRCNLDCTLCYLSERSEDVHDIPLEEIFNRLARIRAEYGPDTNVQITGGDPTLRKHDELIEIVRHAREIGFFPALFTNGIAASRKLLTQLAQVGLCDVAFHVDTTQRRVGYESEVQLNVVRRDYLGRAAGLGLNVIFNTTIHEGNFEAIPALIYFFAGHADQIGLASFQLQAATGRGEWGERAQSISLESVRRKIEQGTACALAWDVIRVGHPGCHSYVPTVLINDRFYPVIADVDLFSQFIDDFDGAHYDRREGALQLSLGYLLAFAKRPRWLLRAIGFVCTSIWRARLDIWKARGRVHRLSFFVQNFMNAEDLDQERIDACSFMVMTDQGAVSMCQHNARRDDYILRPIKFHTADGRQRTYYPLERTPRDERPRQIA